jgi:purine-binding chemotaxis protein CheW
MSGEERYLLVRAGQQLCALPLERLRRVERAMAVYPLPGAVAELLGLAEFAGEPLPVVDLARVVGAAPGAAPTAPVTVVAWCGVGSEREMVALAADAAQGIVEIARAKVTALLAGGRRGVVRGEVMVAGEAVRLLDLDRLLVASGGDEVGDG